MKKKVSAAIVLMLFGVSLFAMPSVKADVYIPPGPPDSKAAWISPTLLVFDMQDMGPIGWVYSDGDMYVATASLVDIPTALGIGFPGQTHLQKIHKSNPVVPWGIDRTVIPFSTEVMVLGFIPGVVVAPDQVPPPVEIVITWNGVPYVVTLTLPEDQIVGYHYPPEFHDDIKTLYEFSYPNDPEAPWKDAYYNIWVGDPNDLDPTEPEDLPFGYYFYYIFHPNVGDWIAWDCVGETKHPPTYDITALFEYKTSQIWFNHVCFDVEFLHAHRTVDWASWIEIGSVIVDELMVTNVGKVEATELDVLITVPACKKLEVMPIYVKARITGGREIGPKDITGDFVFGEMYDLPPPFDILYPGETLRIMMKHDLYNPDKWSGTLVFDSLVSAWEIPPWKYPRAMHSLPVGKPPGPIDFLWTGWKLHKIPDRGYVFELVQEWPILLPICRAPFPEQGTPDMPLDPEPVDLDGGGIGASDILLVRQAIIGLIPYDYRMDVNANGKIDTYDLARYKQAAI